jgi:RNA polymerase sigma-70 factor (ECF subfamily)
MKDLTRRHRLADHIALGERSVHDIDPSPHSLLARAEEERIVLLALRRLSLDDQILFELYEWEQLSASEVGRVLGLTEPAVRSRLHRAKLRLEANIAAAAESPDAARSTLDGFSRWAASLRAQLGPR